MAPAGLAGVIAWGRDNLSASGWHQPYNGASSATVGEALTHVQGASLKVNAVVLSRLVNSPAAGGISSGGQFRQSETGKDMESDLETILGAYLGMNDWLKALWLVTPPLTMLGLAGLVLRHRRLRSMPAGQTMYSISRMDDGEMRVYRHGMPGPALIARQTPPLPPLMQEAMAGEEPQAAS